MTLYLDCLLADASLAAEYSDGLLNPADATRLRQTPKLAERLDWQVSRALKVQTASTCQSLSHSHGCAAILASDHNFPIGIDIEKIKPRDFAALSAWICLPQEQHYLAARHWQAEDYYRLWCIKEALIKATALEFPADMQRVGYLFDGQTVCGLRVDGQTGWHGLSALLTPDFALACVWQHTADVAVRRHYYGTLTTASLHGQKAI